MEWRDCFAGFCSFVWLCGHLVWPHPAFPRIPTFSWGQNEVPEAPSPLSPPPPPPPSSTGETYGCRHGSDGRGGRRVGGTEVKVQERGGSGSPTKAHFYQR